MKLNLESICLFDNEIKRKFAKNADSIKELTLTKRVPKAQV